MTKQTHTVATDALATLGTIIDETAGRDAIHLAVEPIEAGEDLFPGQHIGIVNGMAYCKLPEGSKLLGIVDPFLPGKVPAGKRFWLIVYPRQITSLRHVWEHPSIPALPALLAPAAPKPDSDEQWIRDFADRVGLHYGELIDAAKDWVASKREVQWGEYLNRGGLLEGEYVPDEFWTHYEAVTGESVSEDHRGSFFTCSC